MSRIVIVILIYHRHKPMYLIHTLWCAATLVSFYHLSSIEKGVAERFESLWITDCNISSLALISSAGI
jgi:hypothetical protein